MISSYKTVQDVLSCGLLELRQGAGTVSDRVLKSTRLEDIIFKDLHTSDSPLSELEATATPKLRTFPALSRDMYQAFYSLNLSRSNDDELSAMARKFNAHILDQAMESEDYAPPKVDM